MLKRVDAEAVSGSQTEICWVTASHPQLSLIPLNRCWATGFIVISWNISIFPAEKIRRRGRGQMKESWTCYRAPPPQSSDAQKLAAFPVFHKWLQMNFWFLRSFNTLIWVVKLPVHRAAEPRVQTHLRALTTTWRTKEDRGVLDSPGLSWTLLHSHLTSTFMGHLKAERAGQTPWVSRFYTH